METKIKDLIKHLEQFDKNLPVFKMNAVGRGFYLDLNDIFQYKVEPINELTFKESKNGVDGFKKIKK